MGVRGNGFTPLLAKGGEYQKCVSRVGIQPVLISEHFNH